MVPLALRPLLRLGPLCARAPLGAARWRVAGRRLHGPGGGARRAPEFLAWCGAVGVPSLTAAQPLHALVTGPVELRDTDGKVLPTKGKVWLCRCGASTKKPLCDGTHAKIGFQAAAQAVPGSAQGG